MFGGGKAHTSIHISPDSGPLRHLLHRAFLLGEDVSGLLQLLLVPLQVPDAFGLQQAELLVPVLVQRDVFAHVGVEAEVGVEREEGVEHGVDLWKGRPEQET